MDIWDTSKLTQEAERAWIERNGWDKCPPKKRIWDLMDPAATQRQQAAGAFRPLYAKKESSAPLPPEKLYSKKATFIKQGVVRPKVVNPLTGKVIRRDIGRLKAGSATVAVLRCLERFYPTPLKVDALAFETKLSRMQMHNALHRLELLGVLVKKNAPLTGFERKGRPLMLFTVKASNNNVEVMP